MKHIFKDGSVKELDGVTLRRKDAPLTYEIIRKLKEEKSNVRH